MASVCLGSINKNHNLKLMQLICGGHISRKFKHTCKIECPGNESDKLDLHCKIALVTGGISGIGFNVASELLCAGIRHVAVTGLDYCRGKEVTTCLNNMYGKNKASFINSNISCVIQVQDAFKTVIDEWKSLDILVNCAGICDGPNWEKELVTNLVGTMRCTLLANRFMGKEGSGHGGTIINLAGTSGLEPLPPAPTLSASYYGIVGFSTSFGHDSHVKRSGIRVVTLCPGFTKTDFLKRINERGLTEIMGNELDSFIKLSKTQKPEASAQAVLHLLKCAKSGSVWVCEGSKLYSLNIPDRMSYSTLVSQYLC